MREFIKRNQVFLLVFLFFVLKKLLERVLGSAEMDVVVLAKHYLNNSYIQNDWYLNLGISYRYLYNFFTGTLALFLPLPLVSIFGRIVLYLLFAYLLQEYARYFDLKAIFIIPFLFLYTRFPNIVAGNKIFGTLTTHQFANFFFLFSLLLFMQKKYFRANLALGLSISFHVLIGGYAAISLLLTLLINIRHFRNDIVKIFKHFYILLIAASFGIYAIVENLLVNVDVNKQIASIIYVTLRVPHHSYPLYWHIYKGELWILKLAFCLVFLTIIFLFLKKTRYRIASSFALSTASFFFLGFILYWFGAIDLLKYYWFKLPDVILPFFSFLLFFSLMGKFEVRLRSSNKRVFNVPVSSLFRGAFGLVTIAILTLSTVSFTQSVLRIREEGKYFYLSELDPDLRTMLLWVRRNTDERDKFLVNPFIKRFYLAAERPMFVSYQHAAQSENDILEWHRRMKLCNNNQELTKLGSRNEDDITRNFYNLEESFIKSVAREYDLTFYLGKTDKSLDFPVFHRTKEYILYRIEQASI